MIAPDKVARTGLLHPGDGSCRSASFTLAGVGVRINAPVKYPVTDFLPRHTEVLVKLPGGGALHSVLQSEGNPLSLMAANLADPSMGYREHTVFFGRVLEHAPDGTYKILNHTTKKAMLGVPRRCLSMASSAYLEGLHHFHTGFKRSALLSMLEAIRHRPDETRAYVVAADLLLSVGRVIEARSFARRVTLLDPQSVSGHLLLGQALLRGMASLPNLWEAVLCLRTAHRLEPWNEATHQPLNEGEARLWNALKMEAGKCTFSAPCLWLPFFPLRHTLPNCPHSPSPAQCLVGTLVRLQCSRLPLQLLCALLHPLPPRAFLGRMMPARGDSQRRP